MNWDWLVSITALSALGGLVSSSRAAWLDKSKPWPVKVFDILVGVMMAVGVSEYFVKADTPKLAIFVGLVAGSFGGYLLDAVQALSPKMAVGIVDAVLAHFGYRRPPPGEDDV